MLKPQMSPREAVTKLGFKSLNLKNLFVDIYSIFPSLNTCNEYLDMFQHIYRSARYTPWNVKCVHDPLTVLTLHNHQPFQCVGRARCRFRAVDRTVAHLQHYKHNCAPALESVCQAGGDGRKLKKINIFFLHLSYYQILILPLGQEQYKNQRVKDTSLFRNKDLVIKRVKETLADLGYF